MTGPNDTAPLLLSKFEIRLLLENDAVTVSGISDRSDPTVLSQAADRYTLHQKKAFETFSRLCFDEKLAHIESNKAAIVQKFRERNDVGFASDEQILKEKISRIEPVTFQCLPVQMLTESPFHEFKKPLIVKGSDIGMSRPEEIKYQAFRQVWRAGYYLTAGTKFACDFLVYETDPCVCHAKYMLFARETEDEISALEILLKGRLSVQVAKEPVFAVVRLNESGPESSARITFLKLVWEGKRSAISATKPLFFSIPH